MTSETDDAASRPDEDNPEWTLEEMRQARPAAEVLPQFIGEKATQELTVARMLKRREDRRLSEGVTIEDVIAWGREGRA